MSGKSDKAQCAKDREILASAYRATRGISLNTLMNVQTKPDYVSDVRWRMELQRRANPERYAMAGVLV